MRTDREMDRKGEDTEDWRVNLLRLNKAKNLPLPLRPWTENVATTRSPTDNNMMLGGTEKSATSPSFSERVKNIFGNFFPFTMGTGTGDEAETQEKEEDDDEQDDFGSQVSLNSSTQENDTYTDTETGTMYQFGVVSTISKTTNGSGQSGDFVNMTIRKCELGRIETQCYETHMRIQKWIMKRRRGRDSRPESRSAPSYLGPTE